MQPRRRRRSRPPTEGENERSERRGDPERQSHSDSEVLKVSRLGRAASDGPVGRPRPESPALKGLPATPRGGVTATWSAAAPELKDLSEMDPINTPQEAARRRRLAESGGGAAFAAPSTAEARAATEFCAALCVHEHP